ncbi:DNA polymerase III subunit gamma and tau [Microbacterium sp. STN6]|uniref:DNA polymerase III subunit gamma and tau n=1 Tax=Microbacterium sp. STN6 TaxID=2995588 RepID=UPI002260A2D1|nr:DNA polymerase III subunit gamma and tau [Microbacterium sp. STN6]MCX7520898.1 DNA polymerase III subunit gamma and tau [Microbacterium sp. STN6]
MVTALYRRYRPETFAEMIGQTQVTEPLMTALRADRVNHAYLFSGPRGCGKTTSARILARCLNCVEGPTDTPCGKCSSCIELGRDGGGSLDVVEIDAASHNGVDDARDIRERAIFAPARDRYKIFILDEAHMVTPQGFNALLKIVEEPPEHVKFIFATTEPDKVIGTIRSRTHHYPFRLVPPAQMLDYVQQLCDSEGVTVAPGVLPLVVRAGGGSPRDTLSLLDQLMAGSESDSIDYERAVALLGYTHASLLDEVIDAVAARDASGAFAGVDRVIQTGQDPRRFVEDLLERLRDLIVVAATSAEGAAAVLRGVPQEELDHMAAQAARFGEAELSRTADIANTALTEMTGATSPRLHLELMLARILVPSSDATNRGALARVERLERRVGVSDTEAGTPAAPAGRGAAEPRLEAPDAAPSAGRGAAEPRLETPDAAPSAGRGAAEPRVETPPQSTAPAPAPAPIAPVTLQQVRDSWPQILDVVREAKMSAWMVLATAHVLELRDGSVLVLTFPSRKDVEALKQPAPSGQGPGDLLKDAVSSVLGFRPALIAKTDGGAAPAPSSAPPAAPEQAAPAPGTPATVTDWAVAAIPESSPSPVAPASTASAPAAAAPDASAPATPAQPEAGPSAAEAPDEPPEVPSADADGYMPGDDDAPPDDEPPYESAEFDAAPSAGRPSPAAPSSTAGARGTAATTQAPAATPRGSERERTSAAASERSVAFQEPQRYGEAVVRELLGARFIEEQPAGQSGSRY